MGINLSSPQFIPAVCLLIALVTGAVAVGVALPAIDLGIERRFAGAAVAAGGVLVAGIALSGFGMTARDP